MRKPKVRIVTIHGSKRLEGAEALAVRLAASEALRANSLERMSRRAARIDTLPPHRRSVERAALAVETQFVKGLWVLLRATSSDGPRSSGRCGLAYMPEAVDRIGQAIDKGGWDMPPPRPSLPSSKEIDAATETQNWLQFLEPTEARVLTVGALSKRGDAGRTINWNRVRSRLPELADYSTRTLQGIYSRAVRNIVAELTARQMVVI